MIFQWLSGLLSPKRREPLPPAEFVPRVFPPADQPHALHFYQSWPSGEKHLKVSLGAGAGEGFADQTEGATPVFDLDRFYQTAKLVFYAEPIEHAHYWVLAWADEADYDVALEKHSGRIYLVDTWPDPEEPDLTKPDEREKEDSGKAPIVILHELAASFRDFLQRLMAAG